MIGFRGEAPRASILGELNTQAQVKRLLQIRNSVASVLSLNAVCIDLVCQSRLVATDDLIEFANNISHSLHAPRLWNPSQLLIGGRLPAPQPEQMRAGALALHNADVSNRETLILASEALSKAKLPDAIRLIEESVAPTIDRSSVDNKRKTLDYLDVSLPKKTKININYGIDSDSDSD